MIAAMASGGTPRVLTAAAVAAVILASSSVVVPAPARAAPPMDEIAEEGLSMVETLFETLLELPTIRDMVNEGCRNLAVVTMHEVVSAQYAFEGAAERKANRKSVRSWASGEFIKGPRPVKRPFAKRINKLRRLLEDGKLLLSCYEFETGLHEGIEPPAFFVTATPRACGKVGDRSYYFDETVGYRYEEGCLTPAGSASPSINDLIEP